jgi:hypothetical protein
MISAASAFLLRSAQRAVMGDQTDIRHRLRWLNVHLVVIELVVVEPPALASAELRGFIAETRCDVLLVG